MSLSAAERETTVTVTDADDVVRIYTCQRRFITRLRKHPKATEVRTGKHSGTEYSFFEIPASQWNPVSGIKRESHLTDEQRQAAADRLRKARGDDE